MKKDDLIELGTWNGKPLRWRVISTKGDGILVIAEKIIDALPFAPADSGYKAVFWSRSLVRERLQKIYEECFSEEEKEHILLSHFAIRAVSSDGTARPLDEADDYLFLPSSDMMEKYFAEDTIRRLKSGRETEAKNLDRLCQVDGAALEHGLAVDEDRTEYKPLSSSAYCAYWLSMPTAYLDDWQLCVESTGHIKARNNKKILGIRPVMRLAKGRYRAVGTFRYEEESVVETPHVFETVALGSWEGQSLRWLVLKEDGDRKLVIAERGVAEMPFHKYHFSARSYSSCNARKWLAGEFYEKAFSEEEKKRILTTTVRTAKSPTDISAWQGPDDLEDPLFIPLYEQVKETFPSHIDLFCYPLSGGDEPVGWWLRDHCTLADKQYAIAENWLDDYYTWAFIPQDRRGIYVRPAMWITAAPEEEEQ